MIMHNAEKNGKKVTRSATGKPGQITAGNIAYYAIVKLRNGCRSNGIVTGDVYGSAAQIQGRTRLNSLEEVVSTDEETGGEIFQFHDVLADEGEDPATKATRKMDWESFMSRLSDRDRAIIRCMVEGDPLAGLARQRRINYSTLVYHTRKLAQSIREFMGQDILAQVQRSPGWKNNITATRERMACRVERRLA
jgi:hypothetical protein